jgi:hypothetical protein
MALCQTITAKITFICVKQRFLLRCQFEIYSSLSLIESSRGKRHSGSRHVQDEFVRHGLFDLHDSLSTGTVTGDKIIRIKLFQFLDCPADDSFLFTGLSKIGLMAPAKASAAGVSP